MALSRHSLLIGLAQISQLVNGMKLTLKLYQVFKFTINHPSAPILFMEMVIMERKKNRHMSPSIMIGMLFINMKLNGLQTTSAGQ